jgi:dihydroorotase
MRKVTIPKPINGHGHLRQELLFEFLVRIAMFIFSHYLGMGNTKPPILDADSAEKYKEHGHRVRDAKASDVEFNLHTVIKVREDSSWRKIREAIQEGFRFFKFYPKSKTTHADDGIVNYFCPSLVECYRVIAEETTPDGKRAHALFHGEHPNMLVDDSEAEYMFFGIFEGIYNLIPELLMTWCHLTDSRVVPFLQQMERVLIELAVHYGYITENDTHGHNHNVSRPPAKGRFDRDMIRQLIVNGIGANGFDDAPWEKGKKECAHSMCGVWNLVNGIPLILQIFDEMGVSIEEGTLGYQNLVRFTSGNAVKFYNLPEPQSKLTLVNRPLYIWEEYRLDTGLFVPFRAGMHTTWDYEPALDFQALAMP